MTARTVPTLPTFNTLSVATSAQLGQLVAWNQFWANPPMFRMYQTAGQIVASGGANLQVTFDTSDYDTDGGRGLTSPWAYTIPVGMSGRWRFTWSLAWPSNATGSRAEILYKNGTRIAGDGEVATDNDVMQTPASMTILCAAGDVMSVYTWQNSASSLTLAVGANNLSYFEGKLESLANP